MRGFVDEMSPYIVRASILRYVRFGPSPRFSSIAGL